MYALGGCSTLLVCAALHSDKTWQARFMPSKSGGSGPQASCQTSMTIIASCPRFRTVMTVPSNLADSDRRARDSTQGLGLGFGVWGVWIAMATPETQRRVLFSRQCRSSARGPVCRQGARARSEARCRESGAARQGAAQGWRCLAFAMQDTSRPCANCSRIICNLPFLRRMRRRARTHARTHKLSSC